VATRISTGPGDHAPRIALDAANKVFIVWDRDGSPGGIYVATNQSGTWVTTQVTSAVDESPTIAVTHGAPYTPVIGFSRADASTGGIYTAALGSGSWTITRVTTAPGDTQPSVALDSADRAQLVYVADPDGESPGVYHTRDTGSGWSTVRIVASRVDSEPSLALDSGDNPSVVFGRSGATSSVRGVWYARQATRGGAFVLTRITSSYTPTADGTRSLSPVAVNGAGKAAVAIAGGGISLYSNRSGVWARTVVTTVATDITPSLAVDPVVGAYQLAFQRGSVPSPDGVLYGTGTY